ncbi:hypothetical protein [Xanthobacter versatilis]|uniref:hypothetical protein n=1 Tax=Xanthobacter autotrophicus (strain ATCC BAA-1158 / Py2) TaxID=78245 RepID=UPI00372C8F87
MKVSSPSLVCGAFGAAVSDIALSLLSLELGQDSASFDGRAASSLSDINTFPRRSKEVAQAASPAGGFIVVM